MIGPWWKENPMLITWIDIRVLRSIKGREPRVLEFGFEIRNRCKIRTSYDEVSKSRSPSYWWVQREWFSSIGSMFHLDGGLYVKCVPHTDYDLFSKVFAPSCSRRDVHGRVTVQHSLPNVIASAWFVDYRVDELLAFSTVCLGLFCYYERMIVGLFFLVYS